MVHIPVVDLDFMMAGDVGLADGVDDPSIDGLALVRSGLSDGSLESTLGHGATLNECVE